MRAGYVGAKSFLEQVHSLVIELKANNKDMMFVCDPVMGDNGEWVYLSVLQCSECNSYMTYMPMSHASSLVPRLPTQNERGSLASSDNKRRATCTYVTCI